MVNAPGRAMTPVRYTHSIRNLILIVRADPIICGHSTEARNLAEAAIEMGIGNVHIVSYPIDVLEQSDLPLKPLDSILPYSPGITVDRPSPIGDYKVLDQRLTMGIGGHLVDLLYRLEGSTVLMDLYLVPHGAMVISAVRSFESSGRSASVFTVSEAVGSDITNVVNNAIADGRFGAAQMVLSNYLEHDLPVAVSDYTREIIIKAGEAVDDQLRTNFANRLSQSVQVSYPAIDTASYLAVERDHATADDVLNRRQLRRDGYVMFLSRIAPAKGVDDLIEAYRSSQVYGVMPLVICGDGPSKKSIELLAAPFSSVYCLTAHWRQAPTLPSAGCQQKYGMSRPSDRHACNRLSAPLTSSALPSTWIVAMVQSSSLARVSGRG